MARVPAPTPTPGRIDREILHELMQDATLPVTQVAERFGLSQAPCWKRMQKLEAAGGIFGRVALMIRSGLALVCQCSSRSVPQIMRLEGSTCRANPRLAGPFGSRCMLRCTLAR